MDTLHTGIRRRKAECCYRTRGIVGILSLGREYGAYMEEMGEEYNQQGRKLYHKA